jgi:hypothetical protein
MIDTKDAVGAAVLSFSISCSVGKLVGETVVSAEGTAVVANGADVGPRVRVCVGSCDNTTAGARELTATTGDVDGGSLGVGFLVGLCLGFLVGNIVVGDADGALVADRVGVDDGLVVGIAVGLFDCMYIGFRVGFLIGL